MPTSFEETLTLLDGLIEAARNGTISLPASDARPQPPQPRAVAAPSRAASSSGKKAAPPSSAPPGAAKSAAQAAEGKKKEKIAGAEPSGKPSKKAPAPDRPMDVSWLDLRVGHILEAEKHPDSDKLYVEKIDVGEEEPRTILSGLAHHMPLDRVRGARVVVCCNLPPRPLAGIPSHGMVLCASEVDGEGNKGTTEFVTPPEAAKVGERITFDKYPGEPEEEKRIKKKDAWKAVAPDLATDGECFACYKGSERWMTSAGPCKVISVKSSPIS